MANPRPLTNNDDENPEWTEVDFAKSVPFSGLPVELQKLISSPKQERKELPVQTIRQRQPAA
ncbi:MAG: hypothetical protein ABR912_03865 [Terracidiphilus sp.]|jgi:hypothetical protein